MNELNKEKLWSLFDMSRTINGGGRGYNCRILLYEDSVIVVIDNLKCHDRKKLRTIYFVHILEETDSAEYACKCVYGFDSIDKGLIRATEAMIDVINEIRGVKNSDLFM